MNGDEERSAKISKVRDRGQLTVPLAVRRALAWPEGEVPVRVIPLPEEDAFKVERITAAVQAPRRKLTEEEWNEIWQSMRRISRLGEPVDLVEFLVKDRESH